jgi:hypothetical protein
MKTVLFGSYNIVMKYMKKIYIFNILFMGLSIFTSCSEDTPTESNNNLYTGTWLWVVTTGGFAGQVIKPEEGTTLKILFDDFSNFRVFRNDTLLVSAKYRIEKLDSLWDSITYSDIITYKSYYFNNPVHSKIDLNKLTIWDGWIDGYSHTYKKIDWLH